jgi:hypothetical protein
MVSLDGAELLSTVQGCRDRVRHRDHPVGPLSLGLGQCEVSTRLPLQRASHAESALVEVDAVPAQAKDLALPHAEGERDHPSRLESVIGCGGKQTPRLLDRVGIDLRPGQRRWIDHQGGVPRDEAPPDCHRERPAQDGVNPADAGGPSPQLSNWRRSLTTSALVLRVICLRRRVPPAIRDRPTRATVRRTTGRSIPRPWCGAAAQPHDPPGSSVSSTPGCSTPATSSRSLPSQA